MNKGGLDMKDLTTIQVKSLVISTLVGMGIIANIPAAWVVVSGGILYTVCKKEKAK